MARREKTGEVKLGGSRRPDKAGKAAARSVARGSSSWAIGGLLAAALVIAVFAAYYPAWHGAFLWDDDLHLLANPVLKPGGLARAWVPGSYINYWPLTFTVYRLEFETWGLNSFGFHLVNIGLHAVTALLVWRVLVELRVPGALAAAAIFALHPVNVESVAWISQLKGVLSLVFAVLSTLFYLQHDRMGGRWRYLAAVAAFGLSTLAKGMAITLPAILLALVWWRRGAIHWRDVAKVLPLVLIGVMMAGVEVSTQQIVREGASVRGDDLLARCAVAGCAAWFYFLKLIWPLNLCFVYPRWEIDGGNIPAYLPGLSLAALLALCWWHRRTWGRPWVMLIVCYVGLLAPALGFVNVYFMRYSLVADHWQYAATIVPCAVLTGVAAGWVVRAVGRKAAFAATLALLAVLAGLTWRQSGMYADNLTLFTDTIEKNPECWMAHNNLASELAGRGQLNAAIAHCRKALELKSDFIEARASLGIALGRQGNRDEALAQLQQALDLATALGKRSHADAIRAQIGLLQPAAPADSEGGP